MKNLVGNMAIRKYRINVTKVLIILYMCMPLADTLNGYILLQLKSEFSVGQLYRIVLIFFTGFVFLKRGFSKILFEPTLILAAIFVLLSCIHIGFGNPLKEEILLLSQWILLPILLSGLLELKRREEFGKRETGCIFEVYSWMVPATIIIPKMMGIGFAVYSGGLGYKGLYYANNGVSFLVSVLVIYAFGRLFEKRNVLGIVKVCLLVVTCLLLGTKACMAAVAVGLFFSIFLSFRKNVVRGCATTLVVLVLFVAAGFVFQLQGRFHRVHISHNIILQLVIAPPVDRNHQDINLPQKVRKAVIDTAVPGMEKGGIAETHFIAQLLVIPLFVGMQLFVGGGNRNHIA